MRVSDCLLLCSLANVVVVSPSREARRRGARPVWLSRVLSLSINDQIVEWLRDGGPSDSPLPPTLETLQFDPNLQLGRDRRVRDLVAQRLGVARDSVDGGPPD